VEAFRHVGAVSGERLRREIELLLLDAPEGEALAACDGAGGLRAIDPSLRWDPARTAAYADPRLQHEAGRGEGARLAFGFALLASAATQGEAARISERLRLKRAEAGAVNGLATLAKTAHLLARRDAKPSGVLVLLARYPATAVAAFAGLHRGEIAGQLALRYLAEWRHVKPSISGAELQSLGVPAGPQVQRGLQLLRAARLDGTAPDAAAERELAARFARSIRDSKAMTAPIDMRTNGH
jgi:hypothetical protein